MLLTVQLRMNILHLRGNQGNIPQLMRNMYLYPKEFYRLIKISYSYTFQHWIRRDAFGETRGFNASTQFYVICRVEDFLILSIHEKDRNRSSKLDNEVEHIIEYSSNSCKEINIKRESTKQTKISILIVVFYIYSFLNDIV